MFEITKTVTFSAAHALRDYDGPCARKHGHNYRLEVVVRGDRLDDQRMLMDFFHLHRVLDPLMAKVDHRDLNTVPPFDEVNPTAEAVAAWIFTELRGPIARESRDRAQLAAIRLWETPDACVTYTES